MITYFMEDPFNILLQFPHPHAATLGSKDFLRNIDRWPLRGRLWQFCYNEQTQQHSPSYKQHRVLPNTYIKDSKLTGTQF